MKDKRPYRKCVRIIIRKDNKILLCRRFDEEGKVNNYLFPGGGVEGKDTVEETVVKECLEEVGVKVKNVKLLGITNTYDVEFDKPERAKLYKGNEDIWCVCDYNGVSTKYYDVEGDAMPYTWEEYDNAISLVKSVKFDGGGVDISGNKVSAILRVKDNLFSLESVKETTPSKLLAW